MLTKLKYEALTLLHKAKWYYIEFFRAITMLLAAILGLTILIALFELLG